MKVLFINKFFFPKGGAETSFFATARLLEEKGHRIAFFSMAHPANQESPYSQYFVSRVDFENPDSFPEKMKIPGRILYSFEAKRKLSRLLKQDKPDVAHLHNIHHQISPSILHTLRKWNIPTVMTLHDYKMVCPVYTLFRQGKICEQCRKGKYYHCFLHRCSKDSYPKSLLNTMEMYLHHRLLHLYRLVDVLISPSRFLKEKIREMGMGGKVAYLPHFINVQDFLPSYRWSENSIVYFGRLSAEKGLFTLLKAVKGLGVICKIVGDGPLRSALENKARHEGLANVSFLGYRSQEQLKPEIQKSLLVVLPSEWYENNSRSLMESYALGKPVIGSRIGGIPEFIEDDKTGLLFEPGNPKDLREKIVHLTSRFEKIKKMGENGRKAAEENFNPESYYHQLMILYKRAMERHG